MGGAESCRRYSDWRTSKGVLPRGWRVKVLSPQFKRTDNYLILSSRTIYILRCKQSHIPVETTTLDSAIQQHSKPHTPKISEILAPTFPHQNLPINRPQPQPPRAGAFFSRLIRGENVRPARPRGLLVGVPRRRRVPPCGRAERRVLIHALLVKVAELAARCDCFLCRALATRFSR